MNLILENKEKEKPYKIVLKKEEERWCLRVSFGAISTVIRFQHNQTKLLPLLCKSTGKTWSFRSMQWEESPTLKTPFLLLMLMSQMAQNPNFPFPMKLSNLTFSKANSATQINRNILLPLLTRILIALTLFSPWQLQETIARGKQVASENWPINVIWADNIEKCCYCISDNIDCQYIYELLFRVDYRWTIHQVSSLLIHIPNNHWNLIRIHTKRK